MKGTIKFFKRSQAYGFITAEDGKDIFFHVKDCKEFYPRTKQKVTFDVMEEPEGAAELTEKTGKGPYAVNIKVVETDTEQEEKTAVTESQWVILGKNRIKLSNIEEYGVEYDDSDMPVLYVTTKYKKFEYRVKPEKAVEKDFREIFAKIYEIDVLLGVILK